MKKLSVFTLILLLLLTGCANQDTAGNRSDQSENSQNSKVSENIENSVTSENYENSHSSDEKPAVLADSSSGIEFEESKDADKDTLDDTRLGEIVKESDGPIPAELAGTFTAEGTLPESLESYTLTISPDGAVTQTTVDSGSTTQTIEGTLKKTGSSYVITDPDGMVLMSLDYDGNSLSTNDLTGEKTTFKK